MAGDPLKLIVGLGNPDAEYAAYAAQRGVLVRRMSWRAGMAARFGTRRSIRGSWRACASAGAEIWLLKPMTYMNRSGGPTRSVAAFYKVPVEEILVAHDELDFPPGVVKLKQGGGAAGQQRHQGPHRARSAMRSGACALASASRRRPGIEHVLSRPSVGGREADSRMHRRRGGRGAGHSRARRAAGDESPAYARRAARGS